MDWINTAKGAGSASGIPNDLASDKAGNIYSVGYFESATIDFDSTILRNNGQRDIFITKYNSNGDVLWAKSAGGGDDDEAKSVATDSEGNVFVAGYFNSSEVTFGDTQLSGSGTSKIFLAKYDPSGEHVWSTKIADGYVRVNSIAVDPRGNIVAALSYNDAMGLSPGFSLVKYGTDGSGIWSRGIGLFGSANTGRECHVTTDWLGNIFLAGSFSSALYSDSIQLRAGGVGNMFIIKFDSGGNSQWGKTSTGSSADGATSIATDPDGNVLVAGHCSESTIKFDSTTIAGGGGNFLTKYNTEGKVLWASGGHGPIYSIATDASGQILMTGSFFSENSANDSFTTKYDENGHVSWVKIAAGTDENVATAISVDPEGNVYVAGWFSRNITFGALELTGSSDDIFMAKYNSNGDEQWARIAR